MKNLKVTIKAQVMKVENPVMMGENKREDLTKLMLWQGHTKEMVEAIGEKELLKTIKAGQDLTITADITVYKNAKGFLAEYVTVEKVLGIPA